MASNPAFFLSVLICASARAATRARLPQLRTPFLRSSVSISTQVKSNHANFPLSLLKASLRQTFQPAQETVFRLAHPPRSAESFRRGGRFQSLLGCRLRSPVLLLRVLLPYPPPRICFFPCERNELRLRHQQ